MIGLVTDAKDNALIVSVGGEDTDTTTNPKTLNVTTQHGKGCQHACIVVRQRVVSSKES